MGEDEKLRTRPVVWAESLGEVKFYDVASGTKQKLKVNFGFVYEAKDF